MSEQKIPIPAMLYNAAVGGHVTNSQQIIDENENKEQSQINAEVKQSLGQGGSVDSRIAAAINTEKTRAERAESTLDGRVDTLEDAVGTGGSVDSRISAAVATEATRAQTAEADRYTKSETYTKEEVHNLITTPNQEYVTVTATSQTTAATDVLPATGEADTVYRVGNWDGTQYNATVYSEYAWNGSAYVKLSTKSQIGEVYDISANHADTKYADLSAALGVDGANVPADVRKGGMSVKFVQSSDNKYVQYRLMSDTFNTTSANWQGVDDEPITGSDNLVESGGVWSIVKAEVGKFAGSASYAVGTETHKLCDVSIPQGTVFTFKVTDNNSGASRVLLAADSELVSRIQDGIYFGEEYTLTAAFNISELYLFVQDVSNAGEISIKVEQNISKRITDLEKELQEKIDNNSNEISKLKNPIKVLPWRDNTYYPTRWYQTVGEFGAIETADNNEFNSLCIPLYDKGMFDSITFKVNAASEVAYGYYFLDRVGKVLFIDKTIGTYEKTITPSDIPVGAYSLNINNYKTALSTPYAAIKYKETEIYDKLLYGKKVLMLGDSITEMKKDRRGISEIFAEITGAEVISGGIGASHLTRRQAPTLDVQSELDARSNTDVIPVIDALVTGNWSYVDAGALYEKTVLDDDNDAIIANLKAVNLNDVDILTIFAGTNDSTDLLQLGTKNSNTEVRDVYGAVKYIVKKIHRNYPNIKIYFFTPIPRWYERGDNGQTWSDIYAHPYSEILLPDIAETIIDAAKYCHIPCCDLYWELGWNFYNYEHYLQQNTNLGDGTHPYNGLDCIADKMISYIKSR